MSKCWYCNNELTSGNNPKHFGICNKCYDKMFKSDEQKYVDMLYKENSELLVNSLVEKDKQIAELQKQLEEREQEIKIYRQREYILMEQVSFISLNVERLEKQLKSQPAEIVEKIKAYYKTSIYDKPIAHTDVRVLFQNLDTILKEYQKEK